MSKVLRHGIRTYNSVFCRSLGVISNRFVCLKSSVLQPPDQPTFTCTSNNALNIAKNINIYDNDIISNRIADGDSVEDIMGYLSGLEANKIKPNHIITAVDRLVEVQYAKLFEQNHWMQRNHHIAYIQLLLHDSLQSSMHSFHQHRFFPQLYHILLTNHREISPHHHGQLYLYLCYLGLPLHDPLMAQLLIDVQKRFDLLPLEQVLMLSQILKSLPGMNNTLYRRALSRMRAITSRTDVSQRQLFQVGNVLVNVHKLVSPPLALHFVQWFLTVLKSYDRLEDLDHICTFMRFVQNYYLAFSNCRFVLLEVVGILVGVLEKHVDKMHSHHVAEICRILKSIKYPCEGLSRRVEKRVEVMMEGGDLRLNEVVNLMHCLSPSSPRTLVTTLENTLYSKLVHPEAKVDVVLLSNVADCLLDMGRINEDLLALVHRMTAHHANNIVAFVSRFSRFGRLLARHPFTDPRDQHLFTSAVIHHLEGPHSVSLLSSSALCLHLLFLKSHQSFPHHLYMCFLSSLPRCSSTELCRLMRTLHSHEKNANHQQKQRYIQVLGVIQHELLSRVNNLRALDDLLPLALSPDHSTLSSRHSLLTQRVEDALLSLSHVHNLEQANILSQIMSVNQFYLPSVFDHLFNFLSREPSRHFNLLQLLSSAANIGHRPSSFDSLSPLISHSYYSFIHTNHFCSALILLWSLAQLQYFPEDLLLHLFSIPTLHNIDLYIEGCKERQTSMERLLLQLNRSVVLDSPHLNIPWFHTSSYPNDGLKRRRREERMVQEVGERLVEVVGGERMLRRDTTTPYHYCIDFEVLMDGNNKILDSSNDPLPLPSNANRLAIMVYQNYSYCRNSKVLKGREKIKHRHLKILNYKVVQIPYTDWFSMGLTENSIKRKYLRNKIFEEFHSKNL